MELIICVIQAIISIILPIWIYLWFNKHIRKQLTHYLGLDIQFTLKRWWALWCLSKDKKTDKSELGIDDVISSLNDILKPCADNSRFIKDAKSCDSISFYGADQKGNSLFVKMNHKACHVTELMLQMTLSDGRVFVSPDYPSTLTTNGTAKWSASGLKIESLEPRQRWRIVYNGFLRNQCLGDVSNNDNVEHVRLNLIFMGNARPLEWPGDWSTHLHADALAREPWKGPNWIHKIKLIDPLGYDQWGSIIGQITFQDNVSGLKTNALYLRGICQRRWGKHDCYQLHQTVTFFGATTTGAMYYFGVSRTKNNFSHMRFGHIKQTNETVSKIDWIDLKMNDFEKQGDYIPANYKIAFIAAGKRYDAVINYTGGCAINCYNGHPWIWGITTRNLRIQLNNSKGVGMMIMGYSYAGPSESQIPIAKITYLKPLETYARENSLVLPFSEVYSLEDSVVGGKGHSLALLNHFKSDDFLVPTGFCITTYALTQQLRHHKQIQHVIADIVDISRGKKKENLKRYCEKAVSVIQNTPVEERLAEEILIALNSLNGSNRHQVNANRYAVRSSAIGEDSEETSAAGQNSTYLGIESADVVKSVAKCWASLYSYQSVEYRRQNGLPIKASMGVCIQKMVDAEAAGVMFTRHPTTGDPSSIIINTNYGLGETVVSSLVEPDTLTIHREWDNTLTLSAFVLGSKKQKMSMSNVGVITNDVTEQEAQKAAISDVIALRLAKIGLYVESLFGSARDIEWAVIGEQIYLLQARPITTINAWTEFELIHELDSGVPADVDLITFANIEEVLPNPVSPLSISTIVRILNLAIGVKTGEYNCNYIHTVGMKCGLNYVFSSLRKVNKKITMINKASDIAVCGHIVTTPELHKAVMEKHGVMSTWEQIYTTYDMIKSAWLNEKLMKEATDVFNKYEVNIDDLVTAQSVHDVLNKKYGDLFILGKNHNDASRVSVSYQIITMSLLTRGSEDIMPDHLRDIAVLLSSCTNVISTEVPIALSKIAVCIRKNGKAEEFSKIKSTEAIDWLKSNCPSAAKKLQAFFDVHGHRCVQELDFFSEPWLLKPDSIISTIQTLAISVEKNYISKTLSVEETIASLKTPLPPLTKWLLRKIIPLCRKAVNNRESTKNMVVCAIHKLRLAYKRLGTLMMEENYIPDENLVFFLTHQEIGQLLNGDHNLLLVRKALRRKKIHRQIWKVKYPEFNNGIPLPIPQNALDITSYEGCTKIEGTSVYGGSVMARACVIMDLSGAKNIQHGDILITHCTDIGWSPYFPLLGGIVTELGGLISHGAVVAREYGLPCIVGAKHATQIFRTGDTVLLAGDVGILQLIEKA